MNALIIGNGVGHNIQSVQNSDNDCLADAKACFEMFLKEQVANHNIQFIAEEAVQDSTTIAAQLGRSWANVDMPIDVREFYGIAEEQSQRSSAPEYLGPDACNKLTEFGYQKKLKVDGWVVFEPRLKSDDIREDYMFKLTLDAAANAMNIMVICGINHSQKLAERFRAINCKQVEVVFWENP